MPFNREQVRATDADLIRESEGIRTFLRQRETEFLLAKSVRLNSDAYLMTSPRPVPAAHIQEMVIPPNPRP
jgi:hypothetical protein